MPRVTPAYPDEELRELGEELARLYAARDLNPEGSILQDIARVRGQMRKGPRLHAGEFLADGRYRLVERLQRGGADGYWKAWDRKHAEFVFVQVFHGEWVSDPESIEQFLERGKALTALRHPGIGKVLDAARSDDGFVYLVTQMFASGSLQAASDLDAIAAIQVVVEISRALDAAHEQGVVHADVRPSNVMLSPDGAAHLVGFSVTPAASSDMASLFRAPETTERTYEPSPPADVYALGMTAMQAFNGAELPFWVLRDPARLIHSLDVADCVKRVLLKATDWDLSVRYNDPGDMIEDLLSDAALVEQLGAAARERGRYDVSAEHYERLLALSPERSVDIRTILGELYTALGTYDAAFDHLLVALEQAPVVEVLFAHLRIVAERTGNWQRLAEALWGQARLKEGANRVALRTELARINQYELQDPVAATETWSQVLDDHRTPEQAIMSLRALRGLAEERGDWEAFIAHSKQLLDYIEESERPRVQFAIGRAYIEHLHEEERGLEYIDLAEHGGWSELDLSSRLQQIRAHLGQWRAVIRLMMIQAESQDISQASPTLMRAGIIATAVHLEEEAFAVYHALLERAPRHVVALRHLARMHHRAHEHDKAIRYYERLWETYRGKPSEEPEASERAADCMAYAQLLLRRGRSDEAAERLEEAMRLNANHVPTLQLAGPLFLGKGDMERAGSVFERTLSLFKSVELSPQKIEACLGMGDLCWIQGRLTAAMGWYNRAIELDPFSVSGWWGLAKVALAARGGHPGVDRAPWVMAMPKRFTGNEALARLIAGLLPPSSTRAWLQRSSMGGALIEGGASPMRLAAGVVDVMVRNEVVAPELFTRLREACPDWSEPIDEVQRLWLAGGASTFPVGHSYGWSRGIIASDFDPAEPRAVLPPALAAPPVAIEDLKTEEAWSELLKELRPPPPIRSDDVNEDDQEPITLHEGPVLGLVSGERLWLVLPRDRAEVWIGTTPDCDLQISEDQALAERHAAVYRQGGFIYVRSHGEATILVDEVPHTTWRLLGGEALTVGGTTLEVRLVEHESALPGELRIPSAGSDPGAGGPLDRILRGDDEAQEGAEAGLGGIFEPRPLEADPEEPTLEVSRPDVFADEDDEVVQTLAPPRDPAIVVAPEADVPDGLEAGTEDPS
ncbi:MAG TPA: tetratricopeptide repeat protein, partial [Deltaproteobacteria bacterium]|nr:tetratricopeptide repeat protein [Deltaproteobacteria bacterium]